MSGYGTVHMFVVMLTSTPKSSRSERVRSQSSEARSGISMHGNLYQPNEELFERRRLYSFPFSSDDDTEKDGQEVNCCRFLGYNVKHYQ